MKAHRAQQGFTLIELMIALLLGLIITAAVAQIYATSLRTSATQKAASGILDANVYGLQNVEGSLRMAGLGLSDVATKDSACSAVLIGDAAAIGTTAGKCLLDMGAQDTPITQIPQFWSSQIGPTPPNTNSRSMPQLTVQYRAPMHMRDCEGNIALGPRKAMVVESDGGTPTEKHVDGQVVVERYFVRSNRDGVLELRCDAGRYLIEQIEAELSDVTSNTTLNAAAILGKNGVTQVFDLGDEGALVVSGIDDFQVQLGSKNSAGTIYQDMATYLADPSARDIVAVKLAILARGTTAAPREDTTGVVPTYSIFDQQVRIKADQPTNYIRRVYESTTMLRNARGS